MLNHKPALKAVSDDPKNVVQSLAKGFRVLETFSASEPELTLADVARRASLDNATAFRLLNTLLMLGYVQRVPSSRAFRLSFKALDLGFNAIARAELRDAARPVLKSLVELTDEAASLGVLDGPDVVYVERVQTRLARSGVDARIGSRIPVYCSALGLAMLAHLEPDAQTRVLNGRARVKLTPRTIVQASEIRARLVKVRRLGYAVVDQEVTSGLRTLAAPVFDIDGGVCAAVAIVGSVMRMPLDDFVRHVREPVKQAAAAIAKLMQAAGVGGVRSAV